MHKPKAIAKAAQARDAHKRACLICATTVLVAGVLMGAFGFHGVGLVFEVAGLYLVALV